MTDHEEVGREEALPEEGASEGPAALRTQLDEARSLADEQRRKAESYLDLAQRSQADFQNYKRRVEQEREELIKGANADLLRQLLPILDDLERALDHVPAELADNGWAKGVSLIGQKLPRALENVGLRRIGAEGDLFDPYVHEAVAYEEHPEYGEGQVAGVYRPGFVLNERVIRPAQVVVARARQQPSAVKPSAVSGGAARTKGFDEQRRGENRGDRRDN
jgi:molecular chaperone GrpE